MPGEVRWCGVLSPCVRALVGAGRGGGCCLSGLWGWSQRLGCARGGTGTLRRLLRLLIPSSLLLLVVPRGDGGVPHQRAGAGRA